MNKQEKEEIIEEYTNYWILVERIRDLVLNAVKVVPLVDVISILDRVKTELVQHGALIALEEDMQSESEESVEENESIKQDVVKQGVQDAKVEALLENIKNMEEVSKDVRERINS